MGTSEISGAGSAAPRFWRRLDASNRYGLVLLLIGITYVVSAANAGTTGQLFVVFVQLAAVGLIFTVAGSRRARRLAVAVLSALAVLAVVGIAVGVSSINVTFDAFVYSMNALVYLMAPIVIVRSLIRRRTVDLQTFLGAVAAYLLLGMMFAFCYRAIAEFQGGTPFYGSGGDGTTSDDLFFSFITLTTTGYGNLVPVRNPGQTVAVLEAVTGQLFLVTAVAKVVTSWTPAKAKAEESDQG